MSKWEIKTITPVHIGTGFELGKRDFYKDGNKIDRYDFDKIIDCQKTEMIEKLSTQEELRQILKPVNDVNLKGSLGEALVAAGAGKEMTEVDYKDAFLYSTKVKFSNEPSKIREQIKDVYNNLYIPGSSLKGAIRTALAWYWLESNEAERNKLKHSIYIYEKKPGEPVEEKIFGKDPNYDILRGLQIGDSDTLPLKDVISIVETKVMNVCFERSEKKAKLKWLKSRYNSVPSSSDATPTYVEAIDLGKTLAIPVRFNRWLLYGEGGCNSKNEEVPKELDFLGRRELLSEIGKSCNKFAEFIIKREIDFFNLYGREDLAIYYKDKLLSQIPSDNSSWLLQLGWGTGWSSKTFDNWFEKYSARNILRIHSNCGKEVDWDNKNKNYSCSYCKVEKLTEDAIVKIQFPKTRKIGFENGQPTYPLGWVKIREGIRVKP